MLRLHILQAMHGCRYSLSAKHMQLLFYAYSSFIHSLCRRVFFFLLYRRLSLLWALTIILCWFIFFLFSVFVSFTFYALDTVFFFIILLKMFIFLVFFLYETAFISRFRYRFPRKISHFPNYGTLTHKQAHTDTHQRQNDRRCIKCLRKKTKQALTE